MLSLIASPLPQQRYATLAGFAACLFASALQPLARFSRLIRLITYATIGIWLRPKRLTFSPPNICSGASSPAAPAVSDLGHFCSTMELLPDDLRRIVFAFSAPSVGARQLAARARTLDEFVEYCRLEDEPRSLVWTRFYVRSHWRFPNSASSCTPRTRAELPRARRCGAGMRAAATIGRIRSSTSRVLRARV